MNESKADSRLPLEERQALLEERRKARESRQEAKEALKAEKRALIDQMIAEQMEDVHDLQDQIDESDDPYTLMIWKTDHGVIACRPPKPYVMARFRAELNKTGKKLKLMEATDVLVLDCVVYPSRADYQEILKHQPLLPESIGSALMETSGGSKEAETIKKA